MIEPSTGRIVLYRHGGTADPTPHAAIVTAAHSARSVNLACFSPDGTYYSRKEGVLLQDDDAAPETGSYAEWMPFQKGQAVKTEAAESALHPRIAALEQVLTAGGAIHTLFATLQDDIDARLKELEAKVAQSPGAAPAPNPPPTGETAPNPPAAPAPQPAQPATADAGTVAADVSGAGAA